MKTVNWTHKRGTTFPEQIFQYKENGTPRDITNVEILAQLRKEPNGIVAYTLLIEKHDPENGFYKIKEQIIDIPACIYSYDMRMKFSQDEVYSDVEGKFVINPNVSQDV